MAFITLANAKRIIQNTNLKGIDVEGDIYKLEINYFSKYEKSALLSIKEFIKNPEYYFNEIYTKIGNFNDYKLLSKQMPPAYHKKSNCKRLQSDFQSYLIPKDILEKGENTVKEFKKWFSTVSHLKDKPDLINERIRLKWGINTRLEMVTYQNSGHTSFDVESNRSIEESINTKLVKASEYIKEEIKHKVIIDTFILESSNIINGKEFTNDTEYDKNEIKKVIHFFTSEFKKPIGKLLVEYYRTMYNPDLKIDDHILTNLGFKPCMHCHDGIFKFISEHEWLSMVNDAENYYKELNGEATEINYLDFF